MENRATTTGRFATQGGDRPRRVAAVAFAVLASLGVLTGVGCSSTEPEPAGTLNYETTSWQITGAITADAIAAGATLSLVLTDGGLVTGSLFMPAAVTGGANVDANMAGTWNKRGDTIRFNQVSQTFVSEFAWILTPEDLSAADSVDGSFYDIVLSRIFD